MDQIELLFRLILCDIRKPEFDVGQLLRLRLTACEFELDLIDICRNNSAPGTDHSRQIEGYVTTTTANFQADHSWPDAHAFQQTERCWLHDARQDSQAFSSFRPTTDDIVCLLH